MRITRNPHFKHLEMGGSYIRNMNDTTVSIDGQELHSRVVMSADENEGTVEVMLTGKDSQIVIGDDGVPKTETKRGEVKIKWPGQKCPRCFEGERRARQRAQWWTL